MMVGFFFTYNKGDTPYDFLPNKDTGIRPHMTQKPSGYIVHDLGDGIDGATLPPVAIWKEGKWLDSLTKEQVKFFKEGVHTADEYWTWLVPGDGTPGNYNFRLYIVPTKATLSDPTKGPKHPVDWAQSLKDGPKHKTWSPHNNPAHGKSFGFANSGVTTARPATAPAAVTPATPAAPKPPALPTNIRFRCECGHWFKEAQLPAHKTHCCPAKDDSHETDWAFICECCDTLDEVSQCKPGFPRPKPKAKTAPKAKEEVKQTKVEVKEPVAAAAGA